MKKRTHDSLDFVARLLSSRIVLRTPERHVVIRPGTTTRAESHYLSFEDGTRRATTTHSVFDSVMVAVCQSVPANHTYGCSGKRAIRDSSHKLRQQRIQVVRQAIIDCGLTPGYVNTNTHEEWKFQIILPEDWYNRLLEMRNQDAE